MSIRVITTDRLLLRPFVLDDAQALFAYASAPAFSRHVNYDSPATLAETRAFLERVLLSESCDQMVWAMCLLNQTEVIGTLQITREATDTCTLHYDISHTLYGHGYTTEAVRAVLRWCLLHLPEITHFLADTMATNGGSRRVLEKCGFRVYRTAHEQWEKFADPVELVYYKAERDDLLLEDLGLEAIELDRLASTNEGLATGQLHLLRG